MALPLAVLIDGQDATCVDVLDRGLHYGDGLFETIACRAGRARFLDLHLQRLTEGCTRLGIRYQGFPALAAQIRGLAATQPGSILKLILTRGSATARGYGAQGDEAARTVLLQYRWPEEALAPWERGIAARTANGPSGRESGPGGAEASESPGAGPDPWRMDRPCDTGSPWSSVAPDGWSQAR